MCPAVECSSAAVPLPCYSASVSNEEVLTLAEAQVSFDKLRSQ